MLATLSTRSSLSMVFILAVGEIAAGGQSWGQLKYDSRHSGNVAQRSVSTPMD